MIKDCILNYILERASSARLESMLKLPRSSSWGTLVLEQGRCSATFTAARERMEKMERAYVTDLCPYSVCRPCIYDGGHIYCGKPVTTFKGAYEFWYPYTYGSYGMQSKK